MPGSKMKMVKGKDGKMVPDFAADGVGKMKNGGPTKKKAAKKKAAAKKAPAKKAAAKKMAYGGKTMKPKGMMYGGKPVYKSRMK